MAPPLPTAPRPRRGPSRSRAPARRATRDRILDAAAQRLLARGPTGLVLDGVAADAGVSKGGLLYHFHTKEALVDGLTERMLESFDRIQETLAERDEYRRGRWTRAYLGSTVTDEGRPADHSAQLMAGILAAIGNDTARLESLREHFGAWHRRIEEDGIDPTEAAVVRLAADGLWLSALLGLPQPGAEALRDVLARLREMTTR